jgi:hypothetical protein
MIKLKSLLIKEETPRILIPRNVEGRKEKLKRIHWKKVLKYIKDGCLGSLDLTGTPLEFLPNDLTCISGNLFLSNSKIKKLPDNLKEIEGNLWLNYTPIEYLPKNLWISWNLYIFNTPLSIKYTEDEIRKMVNYIGENIYK